MNHIFDVINELMHIDFFGLVVTIRKDWYDSYYIAIDSTGDINAYERLPEPHITQWLCVKDEGECQYHLLGDLMSYNIDSLEEWIADNWNKEYWKLSDFPVLRTA